MCISYFWLFSVTAMLSTEIYCKNHKNLNDTVSSSTRNFAKTQVPSMSVLHEETKRVIYRDIKNHIDQRPRIGLSKGKKLNIPKIPSPYLEPPLIPKQYSNNKKIISSKAKKNHVTSTTPKVSSKEKNYKDPPMTYIRDHAPINQSEEPQKSETRETKKKSKEAKESETKERINFHIHGHEGPDTYVFGYDTGNGNNRQFRYEERHENGTVRGHYGYYDARGKLRKVYYISHPLFGYESFPVVEK